MQGGTRLAEPRDLGEFHYAQLFRVRRPGAEEEHWLALKDAVEPNRRNLNGLYLVDLVDGRRHRALRAAADRGLGGRHAPGRGPGRASFPRAPRRSGSACGASSSRPRTA